MNKNRTKTAIRRISSTFGGIVYGAFRLGFAFAVRPVWGFWSFVELWPLGFSVPGTGG